MQSSPTTDSFLLAAAVFLMLVVTEDSGISLRTATQTPSELLSQSNSASHSMTQIRAVSAWLPSTSSGDAKSCSSEETASSCHCDPPKGTCCCGRQLDVVNAFPTAHCRGAQQSLGDTWSRSRSPRMGFARRKVV